MLFIFTYSLSRTPSLYYCFLKFALGPPITNKKKNPDSAGGGADDGTQQLGENKDRMGCAPYLQVFQAGQLLHTVAATLNLQQQPDALPFCQVADGSISFHVEQVMQGDVLIRCRHLAHSTRQKISMFRAAFHTGYAPPNVLRFTKVQLDGACNDPRFPDDFFVDLILEPCNEKQAADFYQQQQEAQEKKRKQQRAQDEQQEETSAAATENSRTSARKDAVVSASTYDSMLHRDSRFWEVISDHLKDTEETKKKEQQGNNAELDDETSLLDPAKSRMGPTVGKRRVFTTSSSSNPKDHQQEQQGTNAKNMAAAHDALQTFSIGNELDFLPEPEKSKPPVVVPPKKDSLMEALLGALGEEPARPDTEEIVFEDDSADVGSPAPAPEPHPTMVVLPPLSASSVAEKPTETKPETGATTPAATTKNKIPPPSHQDSTATTESMKEMENILGTSPADMDMDALLADDGDDDFNIDDYNVDDDDAELEDLENFLSQR
jgi:C2 domain of PTEN tumour-suppressor protein